MSANEPRSRESAPPLDLSAIMFTANRSSTALQQIERSSGLFRQLVVADGGAGAQQLDGETVNRMSHATGTMYCAEVSWVKRICQASEMVDADLVLLMPDDDLLDQGRLSALVYRMLKTPEATIGGGPWLRAIAEGERPLTPSRINFKLEWASAPWDYSPWLFYGVYRKAVLRSIGLYVVPATVALAQRLRLQTFLSEARLIELCVVLTGQICGPSVVGDEGFWFRSDRKTWPERLVRWEGYLELEEVLLSNENRKHIELWSDQVLENLGGVVGTSIAASPGGMLSQWAHSGASRARYPRLVKKCLRTAGRIGSRRV